jgi:hypothetical protein
MAHYLTSHLLNLLMACTVFSTACQEEHRRPSRYLIPEGYVGWVRIEFNVEGAPPVPIEEGHYLFKFLPSGLIRTSSNIEFGWATDEFYYYNGDNRRQIKETGWGKGGMIWGPATGSKEIPKQEPTRYEQFFVGTEEQFKKYGGRKDNDGAPKIGPIDEGSFGLSTP